MNEKNKITINFGSFFTSALTIVFITLKLLNIINWSWFWVLSPFIFTFIFGLIILLIMFIIFLICN